MPPTVMVDSVQTRGRADGVRSGSWLDTANDLDTHVTTVPARLYHFFERACEAFPDNLALVCGTERLSYADLDARANRLAGHFVRRGVRPGDRVGLLLERSVNTYVSLLAVLKCGAAFVPLDTAFPGDRIAFIA